MKANADWNLCNQVAELLERYGQFAAGQLGSDMDIQLKPDGSIVTAADKEIEAGLRHDLAELLPGVSIWGEEDGYEPPSEHGLWVIDPIDGTTNYAFGLPLWGCTVSLIQQGQLSLGVIVLPELGQTIAAVKDGGARMNGKPLQPIEPGKIESYELVGCGDDNAWSHLTMPGKQRYLGSFVAEAAFVCTGQMRAMLCCKAMLFDAAAGILAARELGAEIRHIDGSDFDESCWLTPVTCTPFAIAPAGSLEDWFKA